MRKFLLSFVFTFAFTLSFASIANAQGTIDSCTPATFRPGHHYCEATLNACAGGAQTCSTYCLGNQTGGGRVYCGDAGSSGRCKISCSGGGGGDSKGPATVWVRVLSRDGPNNKPISWKGNNSNDKVWDTTWNPDWVPNSWSGNGLDGSGNFQQYQSVSNGSTKTWDLARNKISSAMNFTSNNITPPLVWYTENAEYWSNHFCIGGRGYQLNSSTPQGLTKINEYGKDAYCDLTSANNENDIWCNYQDVDGCWSYPARRSIDNYAKLKRMLDVANSDPTLAWADLRFDEYWTLNFVAISDTDSEFTLAPPEGYTCADARWIKNNDVTTFEEEEGNDFDFVAVPNTNWCQVKNFQPSDDGNLFIFEVVSNYQTISGKVVNSRTGGGISGVQVRVQKLNSSNVAVGSPVTATTDGSGIYSVPNYIAPTDRYTVSLVTTSVSGYIGTGYAINSNQSWQSYIKKGFNIGYTWNNGANADTKIGDASYINQSAAVNGYGCNGQNPDLANEKNRCWFAFDPPYTVSGRIVDYRAGAMGLSGVNVTVQKLNTAGNTVLSSTTATSINSVNASDVGKFSVSNFIGFGDKYRVLVTTPPTGYVNAGLTLNYNHSYGSAVPTGGDIAYSWNHNTNAYLGTPQQGSYPWGNTTTRESSYNGQRPGGADCSGSNQLGVSGRCWFTFDVAPPPATVKIAGNVRIDYKYTTDEARKIVSINEYGINYPVEIAKNSVWGNAFWNVKPGSTANDCTANWPDGSDLPNCSQYFSSSASYLEGEYFTARLRIPNNKYSCTWRVLSAEPNGSGGYYPAVWASGTVTSKNGATYCETSTLRVESVTGTATGLESPMHVNFILAYESNRITGRVYDGEFNPLTISASGVQLVKIFADGAFSGYLSPSNEGSNAYSYPATPNVSSSYDLVFNNYYKSGETAGFKLTNTNNTYRCAWIFDKNPSTATTKSTLTQFRSAYGSTFTPNNLATYPAPSATLERGLSSNCDEISGILTFNSTGRMNPLYGHQLYIFRLDKLGRISGSVNMNYRYINGVEVNQNRNVSSDEQGVGFVIETGIYNNTTRLSTWSTPNWNYSPWACSAKYPDNTENNSGYFGAPNLGCDDFFISRDQYLENSTSFKAIARLRYKPGKYSCTTTATGTSNITSSYLGIAGGVEYEYCETEPLNVVSDPNGVLNASSKWPSNVTFNLSFKENSVVTTIFDKSNVTTAYAPYGEANQTGYYQSSGGYQYYIVPADSGDGWNPGASSVANISLAGDVSNKVCYYYTRETSAPYSTGVINTSAPVSITSWDGISSGFNPARNATLDIDCLNMAVPIRSGPFSPIYHNQAYIFVAPKLYIGPSTISIVNGSDRCSESGTLVSGNTTVTLTPSFSGGVGSSAVFSGGNFDFLNTPLVYNYGNGIYTLNFQVEGMNLSEYGICLTTSNPSGSNPIAINVPGLLPNYPNITDAQTQIDGSIKFYKKDLNKWWQVYNGGIYHGTGSLAINSTSIGEGMPTDAVLVGNANAGATVLPNNYADAAGYVGALVSPHAVSPTSFNKYGLTPKDWGLLVNKGKMRKFDLEPVYNVASTEWKTASDLSGAISDSSDDAVFVDANNASLNSPLTFDRDNNKIILVSNGGGNSTVTIDANVTKTMPDKGVLILLVRGDVVISPVVTDLRMVIYATGNIRVQTLGNDADIPLLTNGGLYSDTAVIIERDLQDIVTYERLPAVRILYPSEIFNNMGLVGTSSYPSVVTESKAFWIIED